MTINPREHIWAEKYRPQTLNDLIIDSHTKSIIKSWIDEGKAPNLGLFGYTPGTGKTSLAKSLSRDLDSEFIYINSSRENGIDVIRNKLIKFASTNSFNGNNKIALLDEADGLTNSSQESLRAFIEEFSSSCQFIITANFKHRLIEPLLNRLNIIDFDDIYSKNRKEIALQLLKRCKDILDAENIKYQDQQLKILIKKLYPSTRAIIIELQKNSINGILEIDINSITSHDQFQILISALKTRNYNGCRFNLKHIYDIRSFYDYLFKNVDKIFKDEGMSIANAISHIYKFNIDINKVKDPELSLSAFCAVILGDKTIKFIGE